MADDKKDIPGEGMAGDSAYRRENSRRNIPGEEIPDAVPAQLKALSNPIRMRIVALLRTRGKQTVGMIGQALGQPAGAVSYHLRKLGQVGLVEKGESGSHDRRESWWQATQPEMRMIGHTSGEDESAFETENQFRHSVALSYQMAYERYLDALPTLPEDWQKTGLADDCVLVLTPDQARELGAQIAGLLEQWKKKYPTPAHPQGATQDARQVAFICQSFRWIP